MKHLLAALLALALATGSAAAQIADTGAAAPATSARTGAASFTAEELELQKALQGGSIQGRISIPDARAANLIQPAGKAWRDFHNTTLAWIGGIALCGMLALLTGFYAYRGRIEIDAGPSRHKVFRFSMLERTNHWMVASSFIVLGLTGLNLTFGRHVLLPLVGPEHFTTISELGKMAHNYLSLPFTLGIIVMLVLWAKDNLPARDDIGWIKAAGGLFGHDHPPAGRFNAGQKSVFWMTTLGGGVVAASGFVLIFPFTFTDVGGQQIAHMIHGALAVLMFAAMLAHIYIGSVGMEGAFDAMGEGRVDYNWAKEHHALWVQQELSKASATPGHPDARIAGAD